MLSNETLKLACDLLINLGEHEKKVEINRQVLGENIDFDAYQVFAYLDTESKNYINEINVMNFLQAKNGISCTIEELQCLIFFYDENFDGKLSYTEFLNLVLSENNYIIRKNTRERVGSCYGKTILSFNVEYSLVKLFQRELDLIRTNRTIIEELKSKKDFNVHDLFHYMKGYGCITSQSIKLFLQKNFIRFEEDDIRSIIKRMDIDRDSKVNFCEFHAFFCFPNLKCTCCSFCNCNCGNLNNNKNSNCNNNSSYYNSKINNELLEEYNTMNSSNNELKSNLKIRLSPQRKNDTSKIQRAQNSIESEFLSPSLSLTQGLNRKFNQSENFKEINNKINNCIKKSNVKNNINSNKNSSKDSNNIITKNNYNKNNNENICILDRKKKCFNCNSYACCCNQMEFQSAENNFLKYVCKLVEVETKIEEFKTNLIMRSDFNVEDAFRIFENPENGNISFSDLKNGLKQLGIFPSMKEVKLLMRRVDLKKKGFIDYSDFFDLLVPYQKKYRDNVERRIPSSFIPPYNKAEIFLLSTKIYLVNLLRLVISCEDQLNIIRENIVGINTQSEKIFNKIDSNGLGYLNDMELFLYFKNNGINCNEFQNSLAFIRFDKNRDGKIAIWEIEEELNPS